MSVVFLIQARARARKAMEILNLITEILSDMAPLIRMTRYQNLGAIRLGRSNAWQLCTTCVQTFLLPLIFSVRWIC
jgi:hypothetical protein